MAPCGDSGGLAGTDLGRGEHDGGDRKVALYGGGGGVGRGSEVVGIGTIQGLPALEAEKSAQDTG